MLRDLSIMQLGQLVDLSMKASHWDKAQLCLDEIQGRLDAMVGSQLTEPKPSNSARIAEALRAHAEPEPERKQAPVPDNGLAARRKKRGVTLEPSDKTPAPVVESVKLASEVAETVTVIGEPTPEHTGPPRDENGKVTRISVIAGDPGFDAEVHENTEMSIWCNGNHIETAHTADTVLGLVKYHQKNAQGRIKTLELHGKVEIRGLD